MLNAKYIKKMSHSEKDWLQEELWRLVSSNNIPEVERFLRDFGHKQSFVEPNLTNKKNRFLMHR